MYTAYNSVLHSCLQVSNTRDPKTNLISIYVRLFVCMSVENACGRILCAFHGKTGAPISMKLFFLCSIHATLNCLTRMSFANIIAAAWSGFGRSFLLLSAVMGE